MLFSFSCLAYSPFLQKSLSHVEVRKACYGCSIFEIRHQHTYRSLPHTFGSRIINPCSRIAESDNVITGLFVFLIAAKVCIDFETAKPLLHFFNPLPRGILFGAQRNRALSTPSIHRLTHSLPKKNGSVPHHIRQPPKQHRGTAQTAPRQETNGTAVRNKRHRGAVRLFLHTENRTAANKV